MAWKGAKLGRRAKAALNAKMVESGFSYSIWRYGAVRESVSNWVGRWDVWEGDG